MNNILQQRLSPSREQLIHALYEAAELEHNLMCTYLYAAFSLKQGEAEGLASREAEAVGRWRQSILNVAIEEMGHLVAVWNITVALSGAPRIGRTNFPIEPGHLPAGVVVKLSPFNEATLQHFIHLERPEGSNEADGTGFPLDTTFVRGTAATRLTPMGLDYETVGGFYRALSEGLQELVEQVGEAEAFCGERSLQLSRNEINFQGAEPVICLKTAIAAFDAIVLQGEGAPKESVSSHFNKFLAIRTEYKSLLSANPSFRPAHPAAVNPVLRRPPQPQGKVWIEDELAARTVDLANAAYGLMSRFLAYAYTIPGPSQEKSLAVDLATGLMRAITPLAERAARMPAGPSNPECNAGMSFTALRDSAPFPSGPGAWRFFVERLSQFENAANALASASSDERDKKAARYFANLSERALRWFEAPTTPVSVAAPIPEKQQAVPSGTTENGIESAEGEKLTLKFEAKRCIHSRFCVTGAPTVFLANVKGPWLFPDTINVERLVDIAHLCPSGAIQYSRKDGGDNEQAPLVNLAAVREAGPYAFRGDLRIDGKPDGYRVTLCRCGASKNKPYCDSSHNDTGFSASGEPPTRDNEPLEIRNGVLAIDPEPDGPLRIRGNLETTSGTGRVIDRLITTSLCRCGASQTKPFCDGSHARVGFKST